MSYIDSKHIAYFSAGRLPVLAPGTDPSLPTLGNGAYNWRGFLSQDQHPHEVDSEERHVPELEQQAGARNGGRPSKTIRYGPVQRVQLYTGFKAGMTEADVASIMNQPPPRTCARSRSGR